MKTREERIRLKRVRCRGTAIVEGALCIMALMLILFGTMEASRAVQADTFCNWSAQEAARWASVRGSGSAVPATSTSISNYVKSLAASWTPANVTVTTTFTPNNNPGGKVRVVVAYPVAPLAGLTLRQNLQVSATAETSIVR